MISNNSYNDAMALNAEIKTWTIATQNAMRNNIRMMSTKGKGDLLRMTHGYFWAYGQINRVAFRFPKHGVFFAKGVGRGYKSENGIVRKVKPGPIMRHPKDWFNSTLDQRIQILADKLMDTMANAVVNATNAKIR